MLRYFVPLTLKSRRPRSAKLSESLFAYSVQLQGNIPELYRLKKECKNSSRELYGKSNRLDTNEAYRTVATLLHNVFCTMHMHPRKTDFCQQ